MASESSKATKVVVVLVLAVAGFFGFRFVQTLLFHMRCEEVMTNFSRFPSKEEIFGLKQKIIDQAKAVKISPDDVQVGVCLESKSMTGEMAIRPVEGSPTTFTAGNQVKFWFVHASVTLRGGKPAGFDRRIENTVAETDRDALEKGGVQVRR